MKTKSLRPSVVFLILIAGLLCYQAATVFAGADEAAIDKVRLAFNAAYSAG